jgi:hypothetical protein
MQSILPGWDPSESLLLWALSHAADDRTGNPSLQNPSFLSVGQGGSAWKEAAVLQSGSGRSQESTLLYQSAGYVLIEDAGQGGSFQIGGTQGVRWAVVRLR